MTYNELAQVLETKNPDTGKLYTLADLNVFKMQNVGTGMLEDGIFSTGKWLKDPANQAIAVKFLKASFQGWIYCRDHPRRPASTSCSRTARRCRGSSDLADERDQQARLADELGGHRRHEQGGVRADGADRRSSST